MAVRCCCLRLRWLMRNAALHEGFMLGQSHLQFNEGPGAFMDLRGILTQYLICGCHEGMMALLLLLEPHELLGLIPLVVFKLKDSLWDLRMPIWSFVFSFTASLMFMSGASCAVRTAGRSRWWHTRKGSLLTELSLLATM